MNRSPIYTRLACISLAALASACATGDDLAGPENNQDRHSDLAGMLEHSVALGVAPSTEGSFAHLIAESLKDDTVAEVDVAIQAGTLELFLNSEGDLVLDRLSIDAADIAVGPGVLPPDGMNLTGIAVTLDRPTTVAITTVGDDMLLANAGFAVELRWAVELEHGTVDLAPIRIDELPFELTVQREASGDLSARLTAAFQGEFWSWADIFALRDLQIDLIAATDLPIQPDDSVD